PSWRPGLRCGRAAFLLGLFLVSVTLASLPARAEIDPFIDARRICRNLLPAFAEQPLGLVREPVYWLPDGRTVIVYQWESDRLARVAAPGWLACWFLPLSQTNGVFQIEKLETSKYGTMSRYDVQQLYK